MNGSVFQYRVRSQKAGCKRELAWLKELLLFFQFG